MRSSPGPTPSFRGRFPHSLPPSVTPSATVSSFPHRAVPPDALEEPTPNEAAANILQLALRNAGPRRNRVRSQSMVQLPYQQTDPQPPVNLVTQPKPASDLNPIPADAPSYKSVQLYNRFTNSYGRCTPPPHSVKGWAKHCLSEEYIEGSTQFAPPPVKGLVAGIGSQEYIFLVFGVLVCLAGIIMWLYGMIHVIRYIWKYYYSPQRSRECQGLPLLRHIYRRKFSKSRPRKGISEGWLNEGQKSGGVIWPDEEQENPYDEESIIYENSLSDTENDYECRYGKPMGRVILDGLVGSMKGGTWLRKVLGSSNSSRRSWREVAAVQSASMHTCHPTFGDSSTGEQQSFTNGNGSNSVRKHINTLEQMGLSDSIRSASGVDMNWERGEVTLAFRRDALLRRVMRADKSRMGGGALGTHARSATSSIRGAEVNQIRAGIHDT